MTTSTMDGRRFADMLRQGAANLNNNKKVVNDLNVFPIPDGDTGDNMYMTIDSGAALLNGNETDSLSDAASRAARGMLLGARGNSGVILSRIFSGISRGLEGVESADVKTFARAFEAGISEAYAAVAVPVEGTILTVYRDAVTHAASLLTEESTFQSYFEDFTQELRRSLERTPELLDVLKEAGVVDSGGAGFVYIAEGMKSALNGGIISDESGAPSEKKAAVDISLFTEDSELKYGYCTEFLIRLQRSKTDIDNFDMAAFVNWLNSVGDSVAAFKDGSIVKVHVHTMRPGEVMSHVQRFGEFLTVKVENMTLQHNEHIRREEYVPAARRPHKAYGIVCVAAGQGIKDTFTSIGCDVVIDGGQSMNPSAEDLIKAFDEANADTVLVFPNNGNIILTARQAASLYKKSDVRIVPSRTIGEGYAAISMLDTTSGDTEAIMSEMEQAIKDVVTGSVSRAVRDAEKDGVKIKKDDYIGFVDDTIYIDCPTRNGAAAGLAEKLDAGRFDVILLLRGNDASSQETDELAAELSDKYPSTEVIRLEGGQPVFDYILIFE